MKKLVPSAKEVEIALARMQAFNPGFDYGKANKEAIAEGFKHEKCGHCEMTMLACCHYVRCDYDKCPMKDKKDKRSLLETFTGVKNANIPRRQSR